MLTVVLGGNGNFGARICRALCAHPPIELVSAGRRAGPAGAPFRSAILDLGSASFAGELAAIAPDLVIHCAGPFQRQDYRVAQACLEAGAHYIDLADGRDFVAGFASTFDGAARDAGVFMVSGASTVPALSSAVVDDLLPRFQRLDEIRSYIAPGQRAPRGAATIAGVFSYAGRSFKWLHQGEWRDAWGWQEIERVRFAGLGSRWAAACDIPDLVLFPERYTGVRTVQFRAALEVGIQHFALWIAAAMRRAGAPLPMALAARPLNRLASLLDPFGGEHGGMLVALKGEGIDGKPLRVEWQLMAKAEHGPEIPCMAAILLARRLADGVERRKGARACMGLLALADFEAEFAKWEISTTIESDDG
jgi:hypothetical protein